MSIEVSGTVRAKKAIGVQFSSSSTNNAGFIFNNNMITVSGSVQGSPEFPSSSATGIAFGQYEEGGINSHLNWQDVHVENCTFSSEAALETVEATSLVSVSGIVFCVDLSRSSWENIRFETGGSLTITSTDIKSTAVGIIISTISTAGDSYSFINVAWNVSGDFSAPTSRGILITGLTDHDSSFGNCVFAVSSHQATISIDEADGDAIGIHIETSEYTSTSFDNVLFQYSGRIDSESSCAAILLLRLEFNEATLRDLTFLITDEAEFHCCSIGADSNCETAVVKFVEVEMMSSTSWDGGGVRVHGSVAGITSPRAFGIYWKDSRWRDCSFSNLEFSTNVFLLGSTRSGQLYENLMQVGVDLCNVTFTVDGTSSDISLIPALDVSQMHLNWIMSDVNMTKIFFVVEGTVMTHANNSVVSLIVFDAGPGASSKSKLSNVVFEISTEFGCSSSSTAILDCYGIVIAGDFVQAEWNNISIEDRGIYSFSGAGGGSLFVQVANFSMSKWNNVVVMADGVMHVQESQIYSVIRFDSNDFHDAIFTGVAMTTSANFLTPFNDAYGFLFSDNAWESVVFHNVVYEVMDTSALLSNDIRFRDDIYNSATFCDVKYIGHKGIAFTESTQYQFATFEDFEISSLLINFDFPDEEAMKGTRISNATFSTVGNNAAQLGTIFELVDFTCNMMINGVLYNATDDCSQWDPVCPTIIPVPPTPTPSPPPTSPTPSPASPTATPTPLPTPTPLIMTPIPTPAPSLFPTPSPFKIVSPCVLLTEPYATLVSTDSTVIISQIPTCTDSTLRLHFQWNFDLYPLCTNGISSPACQMSLFNGNLCSYGKCMGSKVEFTPSIVATLTGVGIGGTRMMINVTLTVLSSLSRAEAAIQSVSQILEIVIQPSASSGLWITGGFAESPNTLLNIAAKLETINYYSTAQYQYSCISLNSSTCPSCPSSLQNDPTAIINNLPNNSVTYLTTNSQIGLLFPNSIQFLCSYSILADISVSSFGSKPAKISSQALSTTYQVASAPAMLWDEETLRNCISFTEGFDLRLGLSSTIVIPFGFKLHNISWYYLSAASQPLPVCDSSIYNCGGTGYPFIFFPSRSLKLCGEYQFEVIVNMVSIMSPSEIISSRYTSSCYLRV